MAKKPAKNSRSKSGPATSSSCRYVIRVELRGTSEPKVWRRLEVPADLSLGALNFVILSAFGWDGGHLHKFLEGSGGRRNRSDQRIYCDPEQWEDDMFDMPGEDENAFTLRQVCPDVGDKLTHLYDMGDSWEHLITVQKILTQTQPPEQSVVCLAGKGACPPDDCGGIPGYYQLLEILNDPEHPDHEEMMIWAGGPIDPEAFDREATNRLLQGSWMSRTED